MPPLALISDSHGVAHLGVLAQPDEDIADFIISVMFLTLSVMVGSFLTLINHETQELRAFTWTMLESGMQIFIAVMVSEAGKDLTLLLFRPQGSGIDVAHVSYAMVCSMAAQVAAHSLVGIKGRTRHHLKKKSVYTRALMGVIARFQAFAWLGFWARLQLQVAKQSSCGPLMPLLATIQMILFSACFEWCRERFIRMDGAVDHEELEWMQLTLKNELEAIGMCISYCLNMWLRFWVSGRMPDPGGVEYAATDAVNYAAFAHPWSHMGMLFALCVLFRVLGDFVEINRAKWVESVQGPFCKRALDRVLMVVVNTSLKEAGWLLLFTVMWVIGKFSFVEARQMGEEKKLSIDCVQARAITAITCSYLAILVIVILGKLTSSWTGRTKAGTLQVLIVTVGFSWRRWFGLCIDTVSIYLGPYIITGVDSKTGQFVIEIAISTFMALAMVPCLLKSVTPSAMMASEATIQEERRRSTVTTHASQRQTEVDMELSERSAAA